MKHAFITTLALGTTMGCGLQDSPPACDETTLDAQILINEFMAANTITANDENHDASDWVELYNYGSARASLCGYGLTDELAKPAKGYLGNDAVLEPGGRLLVWLSGKEDPTLINHMAFKLTRDGGEIGLSAPDGAFVSQLRYGDQGTDFSAAREPDGSDNWVIEWHPSPAQPNPRGDGQPVGVVAEPEVVPAVGDLSERIMAYDVIPELGLRVGPDQVARLATNPRVYVPGYVIFDGREYGPVGVRLKGQNSFQPFDAKPSFRINIDEYVDGAAFFGLHDLTFNNMDNDLSMMHERIAYLVARQVGPASRANHAALTVNGEPYGLYTNVETVKRRMIRRWFEDDSGPLFEATDVDFQPQYIDDFELESGADDRSLLAGLARALQDPNPDAAISAAQDYLNLDGFLDFWAMEAVVGQFDAFPYSNPGDDYFVYADPTSGQLWFLPWGMDETFYSSDVDVALVVSVLADTCLASSGCQQAFIDRVWSVQALTEDMDLLGERERVAAQIAPYVAADDRKPYDDATVAEFQQQMYWFLSGRRQYLETYLGGGASAP